MEKKVFGELILKNEAQFYRIAKSILKKDEDCADAVQEAIARAFESLHTLREDRYAKTWFIRILIRECYRIGAGKGKETAFPEGWEAAAEEKTDYSPLYEALQKLEPEFRVTLELHYLEGFEISEIAAMTEAAPGTVKSRLHRGRKKLKAMLSKEGF